MKTTMNIKIIKLAIVEVLLQCGFERSTEQSLNVLADIFRFYIETIFQRMKGMHGDAIVYDDIIKPILEDFKIIGTYNEDKIIAFLNTQNTIKKHISDKSDTNGNLSLLHILKILPKNVQSSSIGQLRQKDKDKPNSSLGNEKDGILIDKTMEFFIKDCLNSENKSEPVGVYKYEFLNLLEETPKEHLSLTKEDYDEHLKNKSKNIEFWVESDNILKDYKMFERRKVFKKFLK